MLFPLSRSPVAISPLLFLPFLLLNCAEKDVSDQKIYGGSLVGDSNDGPERWSTVLLQNCTATVIAKDLLSTAAHCTPRVGDPVYFRKSPQDSGPTGTIAQVTVKSRSQNPSVKDDIAIVLLSSDVPENYKPVTLTPPSFSLEQDQEVRLAGFGMSETGASSLYWGESKYKYTQDGGHYVMSPGISVCFGDSGGPLFVEKSGEWYLAGVTAQTEVDADGNCHTNTPANLFASVGHNYQWITATARDMTGRSNPFTAPPQSSDHYLALRDVGNQTEVWISAPETASSVGFCLGSCSYSTTSFDIVATEDGHKIFKSQSPHSLRSGAIKITSYDSNNRVIGSTSLSLQSID